MPSFDYECPKCHLIVERIGPWDEVIVCPTCMEIMRKLPSLVRTVIAGNMGPKLKTRLNLDTELKTLGFRSPLYPSEEHKDLAKWHLKKEGLL